MTGADIRNLVITKLEERSAFLSDNSNGPILSGGDDLGELKPVYDYVDEQLPIAANEVLLSAPIHKLSLTNLLSVDVSINSDGTGKIGLPNDFLRLALLKMKEWSIPLHIAISVDHPLYRLQFCKYTRGHIHKPVVVYQNATAKIEHCDGDRCIDKEYSNYLEYYSVIKDHTVEQLSYIKKFNKTDNYHDTVAELIALNCAKKIYEIYGNTELVTLMTSEIQNVQNTMLL
jgi:hypothetical protein